MTTRLSVEKQLMGCRGGRGGGGVHGEVATTFWLSATLNLSDTVITGAIIFFFSKNPAELNWTKARVGTWDLACAQTTVTCVFCFFTIPANQKLIFFF